MNSRMNYNKISFEWYAKRCEIVSFAICTSQLIEAHIIWGDDKNEVIAIEGNNHQFDNSNDGIPLLDENIISHIYNVSGIYDVSIFIPRCSAIGVISKEGNNNQWISVELSQAPDLTVISCIKSKISILDVSQNKNLKFINCYLSLNITDIDVSQNTLLNSLCCSFCSISELNLGNINIEILNCSFNNLSSLDVSQNKELKVLDANYNAELEELNLINNCKLEKLFLDFLEMDQIDEECYENEKPQTKGLLSNLDVSFCAYLKELSITNHKLGKLYISKNLKLKSLNCSNNLLTCLDISNNKELEKIDCSNNNLYNLNISNNPRLTMIRMNGNHKKSMHSFLKIKNEL